MSDPRFTDADADAAAAAAAIDYRRIIALHHQAAPATPQFRTVCQLGHSLHVDAMWVTEKKDYGLDHYVTFNLIGGLGRSVQIGFCTFTDIRDVVMDEDRHDFPNLETAIRCHAEDLLQLDWQWTAWQDEPAVHHSRGGNSVAFSPQDISFALKLAAA